MSDRARILIVDDDPAQSSALAQMIGLWGYETATAPNGKAALEQVANSQPHAMVSDLNMPVMDGRQLLEELHRQGNPLPVVIMTAFGNTETAVETVRDLGAYWFLEKPIKTKELRAILERAVAQRRLLEHSEVLERQLSGQGVLGKMVARSAAMRAVLSLIQQVAPSKATVLLTGETGTGKEVAARTIHDVSPRRDKPFLAINCAALPETLIESELFGHEKGSFTGAMERRIGCFELASGGTLLLDEIGEMPIATQGKLLRVLEDRKVRRLGAPREVEVDVRILAATNRDLRSRTQAGTFREDLYFRINVFEIHLPPLRERREDIPLIAASLISDLNRRHGCRVTEISPEVMDLLQRNAWPGNARELRNVLERAVILCGEGPIQMSHLPAGFAGMPVTRAPNADGGVTLVPGMTVEEAERELIRITLEHAQQNRTRAAAMLGISVKTLFNKLKQYEGDDG